MNRRVIVQNLQKFCHTIQLQCCAEAAGKKSAFCNESPDVAVGDRAGFEICFQQRFITHGSRFCNCITIGRKIDTARGQFLLQLVHQLFTSHAR